MNPKLLRLLWLLQRGTGLEFVDRLLQRKQPRFNVAVLLSVFSLEGLELILEGAKLSIGVLHVDLRLGQRYCMPSNSSL